jgi:tetratricopeptide (TPR) repeat protein
MAPGRNDLCPCGSGRKYKHCCGAVSAAAGTARTLSLQQVGALVALINQERLHEAQQGARALLETHTDAGMLWKILSVALVRQGKDALHKLRRAAQLLPQDAEAHANLGAALHDRRQWEEALASLRRALEIRPDARQALIDAADALRALGRAREAVPLYQRALQLEPRSREAQNNLGNAFLELGECAEAVGCYRLALTIKPDDAEVLCNLGNALRQLGRLPEAITCSQRAIALEPGLSMAHNNLGLCLVGLGRRREAVAPYRQAVKLSPHYVEALNNLGNALRDLGERHEALALHRKAVELDSRRAESHCYVGNVLFDLQRLDEAGACFRRALTLQPESQRALLGLAAVERMQGRADAAEVSCRTALTIDPQHVEALAFLGELYVDRGRFAEAQQHFERALALDPGLPSVYCSLVAHRKLTGADPAWLQGVAALLAKPLPLGQEINLHYALGKYFDDLGQYDEAFSNFRQANELIKRDGPRHDRQKLTRRVDRIIDRFDADFTRECQAGATASELPVLIVGMPRSGTSLTEQILASHPGVFGAGELHFWNGAYDTFEAARARGESGVSLLPGIARDYLGRLTALSPGALRVIDKMPANFLHAGLIHATLPRARIIHMQRHPLDTCLSIYFQNFFDIGPYAHDFDGLAHYYSEYVRITNHWREVLPATALLEIPYELLIEDTEAWTRRMLDFIGLPWDPRCLEFHRTERVVMTASRWQVRQKITASSVGRWRNYEKHLAPLRQLVSS